MTQIHQHSFAARGDRSAFLFQHFRDAFKDSVLDVGCYEAPLRELLPGDVAYTGIDLAGKPDIVLNLDKCDRLPFDDNAFHTVTCIEVLEHLDRLHFMMDEIFRVARQEVIISLPNCWASARTPIERGSGSIAHYGLPASPPADRHKWFVNVSEIESFFTLYAQSSAAVTGLQIEYVEKARPALARKARALRYPGKKYLNRYVHTVFGHFSLAWPQAGSSFA